MSGYPPGVTGNEYEIAGPDTEVDAMEVCEACVDDGFAREDEKVLVMIMTYRHERWMVCERAGHITDLDSGD